MIAQAETQSQERRQRVLAVADLELRKKTLSAKREVLDAALERGATDALRHAGRGVYRAVPDAGISRRCRRAMRHPPQQSRSAAVGRRVCAAAQRAADAPEDCPRIQLLPVHPTLASGCMVVRGDMEVDLSAPAAAQPARTG